jgi:hypothetical protein
MTTFGTCSVCETRIEVDNAGMIYGHVMSGRGRWCDGSHKPPKAAAPAPAGFDTPDMMPVGDFEDWAGKIVHGMRDTAQFNTTVGQLARLAWAMARRIASLYRAYEPTRIKRRSSGS